VLADRLRNALVVPNVRTVTLNGVGCTVTTTDNGGSLARSYLVSASCTYEDKTYDYSRVIGNRSTSPVFAYAMVINGNITTGGGNRLFSYPLPDGDVHANGSINVHNQSEIRGDCTATGSISGPVVRGTRQSNAPALPLPTLDRAIYDLNKTNTISGTSISGTYTFGAKSLLTGRYPLHYRTGNLTIGTTTFSGQGTIYCTGTVTINGNNSYANGTSRVAIIAEGGITITSGAANAVGFLFTPGPLSFSGGATITRGSVVGGSFSNSGNFSVTKDLAVQQAPVVGYELHLPGMW